MRIFSIDLYLKDLKPNPGVHFNHALKTIAENSHFNQYLNTFLNHQPFLSHHQLATSSSCPGQTSFINLFPPASSSPPSITSPTQQFPACNISNFSNNVDNNQFPIKKNNENHYPINHFSNEHLQASISQLFNNNSLGLQIMNKNLLNQQHMHSIYHNTPIAMGIPINTESSIGSNTKSIGFNFNHQNV